jgi:hypothetical protein
MKDTGRAPMRDRRLDAADGPDKPPTDGRSLAYRDAVLRAVTRAAELI